MGKPKDPDYWKKWRAEHPEYRERERARTAARKRTPEQRRAERRRGSEKAAEAVQRAQRRREKHRPVEAAYRKRQGPAALYEQWKATIRDNPTRYAEWKAKKNWRQTQKKAQRHMDRAREIAAEFIKPDGRDSLDDGRFEECASIALVAIHEWRNMPAYREKMARERIEEFLDRWRDDSYFTRSYDDDAHEGMRAILGLE